MALVVRRAFTPKNLNFLRCFKGRSYHITTTALKRDQAYLSNVKPLQSFLRRQSTGQALWKAANRRETPLDTDAPRNSTLEFRLSASCPNLTAGVVHPIRRAFSTTTISRTAKILKPFGNQGFYSQPWAFGTLPNNGTARWQSSCCPCPSPCSTTSCPANCLPPPCQTAPRCVQYMTGYYYYPYGWWFCGPYHNTACAPCGPCNPEALRCGASCVVPSAALAAGTTLATADMTFDLDKNQAQTGMFQQQSQQNSVTPIFQQQSPSTTPNPNAPTPLQNPIFVQENKSGANRIFAFNPGQNPPTSTSVKWPPLNQQHTAPAPKKQPGNNMSTLCSPKPRSEKPYSEMRSALSLHGKGRIFSTRSQKLLQKQDSRAMSKFSATSLLGATWGAQRNRKKVYTARSRAYERGVEAPLQPYEYTAFTKRRLPRTEPLRYYEPFE